MTDAQQPTSALSVSASVFLQAAVREKVIEESSVPPDALAVKAPTSAISSLQSAVFTDEAVKVIFANNLEKYVSYEDFVKAVQESITKEKSEDACTSFNLPSNVFHFSTSSTELRVSMYYPSKVSNLKFVNPINGLSKESDIIMPNLIISMVLKAGAKKGGWKVTGSKYFCTDLPVTRLPKTFINSVNHSARVYLMPMSNTYSEGAMCFGANTMPAAVVDNNLRTLDWYYDYLWASSFNSDLGVRALHTTMSPDVWYALLAKKVVDNQPFPYEWLSGWSKP